jgi:hypothetical protein
MEQTQVLVRAARPQVSTPNSLAGSQERIQPWELFLGGQYPFLQNMGASASLAPAPPAALNN